MADATKGHLRGLRIALTRAAEDSNSLRIGLEAEGATVFLCPAIEFHSVRVDWSKYAHHYEWLVITSPRAAISFLMDHILDREKDPLGQLLGVAAVAGRVTFDRVACVGASTLGAIHALAPNPLVPPIQTAEHLVREMIRTGGVARARILFPRGNLARDTVATKLRESGAIVDDPIVYETRPDAAGIQRLKQLASSSQLDAVVFASPSAVEFAMQGGVDLSGLRCFSIGPTTSDALRAHGIAVAAQAATPDETGLLDAIVNPETR